MIDRFIDRHPNLFGILSVPLTLAVLTLPVIPALWIMHFASYLTWLLPPGFGN